MNVDPDGTFFWLFIIGFIVGFASNAITQYLTTGKVNWVSALVSGIFSGIGGFVGGLSINIGVQFLIQGGLSVSETILTSVIEEKKFTVLDVATSFVTGGFFGMVGARKPINKKALPIIRILGSQFSAKIKTLKKDHILFIIEFLTGYLLEKQN